MSSQRWLKHDDNQNDRDDVCREHFTTQNISLLTAFPASSTSRVPTNPARCFEATDLGTQQKSSQITHHQQKPCNKAHKLRQDKTTSFHLHVIFLLVSYSSINTMSRPPIEAILRRISASRETLIVRHCEARAAPRGSNHRRGSTNRMISSCGLQV
jgi:hypothetical protein